MEPIFAHAANQLSAATPAAAMPAPDRPAPIRRAAGLAPVGQQDRPRLLRQLGATRRWLALHGRVTTTPVPVSAPGWQGWRFELTAAGARLPVLAGALSGPEGEVAGLRLAEDVVVHGYLRMVRGEPQLVATRIERHHHGAPPPRTPAATTVGPYGEERPHPVLPFPGSKVLANVKAAHVALAAALTMLAGAMAVCAEGARDRYDVAAGAIARAIHDIESAGTAHERLEERWLFPLLGELLPDRAAWLGAHLGDHHHAEEAWRALLPELETLRQSLELGHEPDPAIVAALRPRVDAFASAYRAHMALEEHEVLPLIACLPERP